jgi:hypothetical protein
LGIDGVALPPPLELPPPAPPPPEPPLDAGLFVPLPVVVLGDKPMSLQYVGSWVQSWLVEVSAVCAEAGIAHAKSIPLARQSLNMAALPHGFLRFKQRPQAKSSHIAKN